MKLEKGLVLVVSGPSGSGKSSIIHDVRMKHPDLIYSVSVTTRPPREGEVDGKHYFFKTVEQFMFLMEHGGLLEWVNYCDNFYGTPRELVENAVNEGHDILIEVDVPGAIHIKNSLTETVLIFIAPPSFDDLKERIEKRGTESEDDKLKRLNMAMSEMSRAHEYNYVLIDDDLERASNELRSIIVSEKLKYARTKTKIEELLKEGMKYERVKA